MTQEHSAKVSFILVVFLGMLTAITPLATDLYLPALPIMPGELNTTASTLIWVIKNPILYSALQIYCLT